MDDVDYSIIVHKHGWTSFLFFLDGKSYEIDASGVLSNPLADFINLLLSLLNNEKEITISWFGEPGWSIIRVIRNNMEHHLLSIEIGDSEDAQGKTYTQTAAFVIKQKQFLIIGLFQLKKIFHLLHEKSYATDRKEFPYELYQKLIARIADTIPGILV